MMPSVYGCCDQQNNTSASIAITSVTFQTKSYGTTLAAGPTAIGVSDQITTVLNSSNSFTVPTDGLAQYYESDDATKQVFHAMTVGYTLTGAVEQDLPVDGDCEFAFDTTMANTPANSQLSTWPLEGTIQGQLVPANSKQTGVTITSTKLTRADVFLTSPVVGVGANSGNDNGNTTVFVKGDIPPENNNTDALSKITFAAQNLATASSFDLVIKLKMGNGSTIESPAQTITIPVGAVQSNLIRGLRMNSFTTTAIAYGTTAPNPPGDVVALDPSIQVVSLLNSGNSFTTPIANLDPGITLIGMAQGFDSPGNQVLHQYQFNLDTSDLTLSDYPASNIIVRYEFTIDADASNIDPSAGILWDTELGQVVTPTQSGSLFTYSVERELTGVNTNTLIPINSVDFPIMATQSLDYKPAFKAYHSSQIGVTSYTVTCVAKIAKTDGSFSSTSPMSFIIDAENGVLPQLV